ncbi:hypothetical protein J6590_041404 [Homalodisca vitripennis]|nr:hypothetical protein J6590_041404 [Homalodisca vitripennis]
MASTPDVGIVRTNFYQYRRPLTVSSPLSLFDRIRYQQALFCLAMRMRRIALSTRKAPEDYAPLDEGAEAHWEVVQRLLFLYAKLNPGQSYVQGMNEIIGPIYYAFACDPSTEWRGNN